MELTQGVGPCYDLFATENSWKVPPAILDASSES